MSKPWWQSRTLWANAIVVGLTLAVQVAAGFGLAPAPAPDPTLAAWAVVLVAVINMALRAVTRQPLGGGGG